MRNERNSDEMFQSLVRLFDKAPGSSLALLGRLKGFSPEARGEFVLEQIKSNLSSAVCFLESFDESANRLDEELSFLVRVLLETTSDSAQDQAHAAIEIYSLLPVKATYLDKYEDKRDCKSYQKTRTLLLGNIAKYWSKANDNLVEDAAKMMNFLLEVIGHESWGGATRSYSEIAIEAIREADKDANLLRIEQGLEQIARSGGERGKAFKSLQIAWVKKLDPSLGLTFARLAGVLGEQLHPDLEQTLIDQAEQLKRLEKAATVFWQGFYCHDYYPKPWKMTKVDLANMAVTTFVTITRSWQDRERLERIKQELGHHIESWKALDREVALTIELQFEVEEGKGPLDGEVLFSAKLPKP